jgi:hypothetical protein
MLTNPSVSAAVAPIAELALSLLRTPISSSSNSSRASSRSSRVVPQEVIVARSIQDRRGELSAIITTAAQLANAAAFLEPPLNTQQPAAISQLLMVNLAYTVLYETSGQPRRRRQQQQQNEPAPAEQLLLALGLPAEDVCEQVGTSAMLPRRGDMSRLRYQFETALFAMYWGFVDVAYNGGSDSDREEDASSSSAGSGRSNEQQRQRHKDAAGKHIVPSGVHEPLTMTVLDAMLTKRVEPDMQFSLLTTATAVGGFAMALLTDAEPQASAKAAAAAAASKALARAPPEDAAAVAAAIATAVAAKAAAAEAADAVAGTNMRLLRAMLLQLTPAMLKAAEQQCSAAGQKPLDMRGDSLPMEGCVLAMLRRAVGGVAVDEQRSEAAPPAAGMACVRLLAAGFVSRRMD